MQRPWGEAEADAFIKGIISHWLWLEPRADVLRCCTGLRVFLMFRQEARPDSTLWV